MANPHRTGDRNRNWKHSHGQLGGVTKTDFAPWPTPPWDLHQAWNRPVQGQDTPLPIVVWEWIGPANQFTGNILFLPSVWEWDNGQVLDPSWGDAGVKALSDVAATIGKAGGTLAVALGPAGPVVAAAGAVVVAISSILPSAFSFAKNVFGQAGDRPIGQVLQADKSRTYDPPVMAIDLAMAAQAATHNQGFGPGAFMFPVEDSPNIGGGHYQMFAAFTYEN